MRDIKSELWFTRELAILTFFLIKKFISEFISRNSDFFLNCELKSSFEEVFEETDMFS